MSVNPYEEKLKRLLGQVDPKTSFDGCAYVVRKVIDDDEYYGFVDVVASRQEAEKLLKMPQHFDYDENVAHIDDEHIRKVKTPATTPEELNTYVQIMKKMPNIYAEDWTHYR